MDQPSKDGRYYARQVTRVASGVADREQAYAGTHDNDFAIASATDDCGGASTLAPNTATSALERRRTVARPEAVAAVRVPVPVVERPETLPQTASNQPLIALLALLAIGAAGALSLGRRRPV